MPAAAERRIRILIVDDSAVVRGMLSRTLSQEGDFDIIGGANDGAMALGMLARLDADVVILDLEMPGMDGFTALPKIKALKPETKVIISSGLSERHADIALRSLAQGATDYIAKPSARQDRSQLDLYYREMIAKIRALGFGDPGKQAVAPSPMSGSTPMATASTSLPGQAPLALAIASSTGGPQALLQIFGEIGRSLASVPVFITQHMPPTFTAVLAKHLSQAGQADCREAVDGESVVAGRVYVAPGDFHLRVELEEKRKVVRLDQGPQVNYCRPAADPMIASLVEIYGDRLMLLVLTGMGQDGLQGARLLHQKGGVVVAQDEASSIVWGMPKAVAAHGYCRDVLALSKIGPYLRKAFGDRW